MPEEPDEPDDDAGYDWKKLAALLGVGTALAVLLVVFLWPKELSIVSEPTSQGVFDEPAGGPAKKAASAEDREDDAAPMTFARLRKKLAALQTDPLATAGVQAFDGFMRDDPQAGPVYREFERREAQGQKAEAATFLQRLKDVSTLQDFMRGAGANPTMGPGIAAIMRIPEVAGVLGAGKVEGPAGVGGLLGGPGPASERQKLRLFRSHTTRAGLIAHGDEAGDGPGGAQLGGGGGQGGAAGGNNAPGAGGRDPKAVAVMTKYPFLTQLFNPDQLAGMSDDINSQGVWAVCMKQKRYAECQAACEAQGSGPDGKKPLCSSGGGWSACMGTTHSETQCIQQCKGQPGCSVPPDAWERNCAKGRFGIPPSYCLGF